MIKSIIITHQYPLDAPGGGTRSCVQIGQHLEKMGVEVIFIPISNKETQQVNSQFTQVFPVSRHPVHYLLTSFSVAQTVKKILSKKQVDAVISWDYEGAFLLELLKSKNVPFGMIAARPSYEEWINRKTGGQIKHLTDEWFRWRLFKNADVAFVSSEYTREEMINLFGINSERIKITHRGIDNIFAQAKRSQPDQVTNFIFYGSFAPIKGVFDAIAALGAVRDHKNWTLKLAGWHNEEAVKAAIREQGIEKQVSILGKLTPEELVKELEWAHVAILPSQAESFGRAIAEAQAAGLPVISYDIGSIPEIVENGVTGWLAPHKHVDKLAQAITEAIQNPEKTFHMGMKGRDRVTKLFSWENTAKLILEGIETAKQGKLSSHYI
ncbi:MAG: glycosyltransferase family 4 protein [Rivularia sp. (in: cyanobacteria)]